MSKWTEVENKKVLMSMDAVAIISVKGDKIEEIKLEIGDQKIIINKKILDVLDDLLDELCSQGLGWE